MTGEVLFALVWLALLSSVVWFPLWAAGRRDWWGR